MLKSQHQPLVQQVICARIGHQFHVLTTKHPDEWSNSGAKGELQVLWFWAVMRIQVPGAHEQQRLLLNETNRCPSQTHGVSGQQGKQFFDLATQHTQSVQHQ